MTGAEWLAVVLIVGMIGGATTVSNSKTDNEQTLRVCFGMCAELGNNQEQEHQSVPSDVTIDAESVLIEGEQEDERPGTAN